MKAKEFLNKIMRGDKATIKDNVGIIAFSEKGNETRGFKIEPNPVFSINNSNKMVITCSDATATIYYKKSTESSWTAYSNPINTPASACTYQAYAKSNDDDYKDSAIVSYEWIKIATPVISISDNDLKITITCATNDVTIKYRKGTSGSFSIYSSSDKPTAEAGQTYQAKAEKLGMITSDTASETAPVLQKFYFMNDSTQLNEEWQIYIGTATAIVISDINDFSNMTFTGLGVSGSLSSSSTITNEDLQYWALGDVGPNLYTFHDNSEFCTDESNCDFSPLVGMYYATFYDEGFHSGFDDPHEITVKKDGITIGTTYTYTPYTPEPEPDFPPEMI